MKFVDFVKKAWAWIVKAAQDLYTFVYVEGGAVLSFFKYPDKSKYSVKRVAAAALIANGLWLSHYIKSWLDAVVALSQVVVGVVLLVVAMLTKT